MVRRKVAGETSVDPDSLSIVDAALYWASKGVSVFPCKGNKRPLTENGFKDAVKDPQAVRKLFEFYGNAARMVGASMGDPSGMFAIDFDLYKGPEVEAWMQGLIDKGLLPESRIHKTARGGVHVFYNGGELPQSSYPTDGVEIRGNGAYVIMPGGGAGYSVLTDEIVPAPKALLSYLASIKKQQSVETVDGLKARILAADNFHDSIARLAARYSAMGWDQERVTASIMGTLKASIASDENHPRHDRWKFLMENQQGEFLRAITTAHSKYNSNAASAEFNDKVDQDTFERMKATAASVFKSSPHDGEEVKEKTVDDWAGKWPFDGEGYFAHQDHDLLSQRFILHPILCEDESILIAAEPKSGKTAVALTVGLHVATGRDLGPSLRVAEPRGVIYFALEGRRAVQLRIAAWRRHLRELGEVIPDFIPLFVVERGKNLLQEVERANLANAIAAAEVWMRNEHGIDLGLFIIDTYTKAMPGGNQNSVEDTSSVFDVVGRVRDLGVSAAAAFIHHKARAGNIRGSTNIEADPDVLTSVFKNGDRVTWSLDRARSVEDGLSFDFSIASYSLGVSKQGHEIKAPVITPIEKMEGSTTGAVSEAMKENKVAGMIVALGKGTHPLEVVMGVLAEAGLAPMTMSLRRTKSKPAAWHSSIAQEFFLNLIPEKGWAFAGVTMERVLKDGKLAAIHIY